MPIRPAPPAALQDLYAIFSHEIRREAVGNVYQGVGNRFQLEGISTWRS